MSCPGCEVIPLTPGEAGTLYIAPNLAHTRQRVQQALSASDTWAVDRVAGSVLRIDVPVARLAALYQTLAEELYAPELEHCQSIFVPRGGRFDESALASTEPLARPVARAQNHWLSQLLANDRLLVHFQPIVHAGAGDVAFAHEALLRGEDEDGSIIPPARLFGAARDSGLLFHLDRAARIAAILQGAARGVATPLFINFNPTSIYDPGFCLRTTLEAARSTGVDASLFVFEVVESDQVRDSDHLLRILQRYREAGFRVALDDLGAGYGSLNLLKSLKPDFVKIDMDLVRDIHLDAARQSIVSHLVGIAADMGIQVIAEGVEDAEESHWLTDAGVDYLQGFHFARPQATPWPAQQVGRYG